MTRKHDPAWVWMIGAFGGALVLAVAVLADYGTGPDGIGQAVRYTARWSFLFFWLSYTGGAMATLFGPAFAGLARRARPLGLAFAAADHENDGHCVAIGVRKRQRRVEPALVLRPLGEPSAQTKQRQRTVPCYLDLAPRKRHVGLCECLDHCFLGREPCRQSVHPVATPAVVDFARRKNLAQVPIPERRQ